MWLYQLEPFLFYTRNDFVTWLIMNTGIHRWFIGNQSADIFFDLLFYSAPILLFVSNRKARRLTPFIAGYMLVINWLYVQCYTLYPTTSIEGKTSWLLFPVIFLTREPAEFRLLVKALRYFFLFIFFSSGLWKFAQGGIFHLDQMSGILLEQHKDFLATSPDSGFSHFISWLIHHQDISYLLYLVTALIQVTFLAGFFTARYDRWLALTFCVFLVMDHLVMRITYYDITPFLLTLLIRDRYSTYLPAHMDR